MLLHPLPSRFPSSLEFPGRGATELPGFLFFTQVDSKRRGRIMSLILLIILVLLVLAVVPTWPYSRDWGYYPSGGLGIVLIIILILVLSGRI
jgi:low affinity Fe/Cu permease